MIFSFLVLCTTVHAQAFLTWNNFNLESTFEPGQKTRVYIESSGARIEQPPSQTYSLSLRHGRKRMDLSEQEFGLVAALFAARPTSLTCNEIIALAERENIHISECKTLARWLNSRMEKLWDVHLVKEDPENATYRLVGPPEIGRRVDSPPFEFEDSGKGIYIEGRFIPLTRVQLKMLNLIWRADFVTYDQIQSEMGWIKAPGATIGRHPLQVAEEINSRVAREKGLKLIYVQKGEGLGFSPLTPQVLPDPARHKTDFGKLELNPKQELVFQRLKLWTLPKNAELAVEDWQFYQIRLSLKDFLRALSSINQQFERQTQEPLIRKLSVDISKNTREALLWKEGRFIDLLQFSNWRQDMECLELLRAARQPDPNQVDWRLVD